MTATPSVGAATNVYIEDVAVGDRLPQLSIDLTPTFVIATAFATRDFQPVHHDRDRARHGGADDVFLNILTTNGLCCRLVTDWAGPAATLLGTSIRLGVPACAGDTLVLSGTVTEVNAGGGGVEVAVVGRDSKGDHVTGTVRCLLPSRSAS